MLATSHYRLMEMCILTVLVQIQPSMGMNMHWILDSPYWQTDAAGVYKVDTWNTSSAIGITLNQIHTQWKVELEPVL